MPRPVASHASSALRGAAAVGLLGLLVAAAAWGQSGRSREEALEEIRAEIARLQSRLGRVQQEERTLEQQLQETRLRLELQEQRVGEAGAAVALARERVERQETAVAALEAETERTRAVLQNRLVSLHRLGRAGYLRLLFSVGGKESALSAVRQLRYLARRDHDTLDRYLDTKVRLELERETLAGERARVEGWLVQEESRQRELEVLRAEQGRLLAAAEQQRRRLETRAEELEDKERKLSNFVAFLYGRSSELLSGQPLQGYQGVLDWPVDGRVQVPFGPRTDPRYGTKVPHNGVEIATRVGDEVATVYPGEVLFAAHFKGYGPTVIVHHPGRVFTLYAGLASLRVGVGDMVGLGHVVGAASDALYFEIRIENHPEDPQRWLRP